MMEGKTLKSRNKTGMRYFAILFCLEKDYSSADRLFRISSFFIRERRVLGLMSRISAAPFSPWMRQLHWLRIFIICVLSTSLNLSIGGSSGSCPAFATAALPSNSPLTLNVSPLEEITARSIIFCNSLILPGQSYLLSNV